MSKQGLYIQLYNIHGLIRGTNLELGRDADTGGQTKYVLELAYALSSSDRVRKVEIITRKIKDKNVSNDYSVPIEKINDKLSIVRLRCGGSKYIRKELLWDSLEEFTDKTIKFIKSSGDLPDIIHGHYADAGYVCSRLTKFFGIPFIQTGHSLGRLKKHNLMINGVKEEDIEKKLKISKRIAAEEDMIFYADRVITSTNQEISDQYGMYKNTNADKFFVIPPGVDLDKFYPYSQKREWNDEETAVRNSIRDELWKFFTNMYKPLILLICRPDKRKNISGLIEAFGENKELQEKANLAIYAGIRKDIQNMEEGGREVLTEMLLLLDKYNLYGKMAIPKKHDFEMEVPEMYRIAAETRGVFVNSAYTENFGLTLIEAASVGLPVVSTDNGGPHDIINNLNNGILVDVAESKNISQAIYKIIDDGELWKTYSINGVNNVDKFYSWDAHTNTYLNLIDEVLEENKRGHKTFVIKTGKKLLDSKKMMFFDIDETMTGNDDALDQLNELLVNRDSSVGFGVATGRKIDSAQEIFEKHNLVKPDVIISSVGSEIYYNNGKDYEYSTSWDAHIQNSWKPDKIRELLKEFDFIKLQVDENQRKFKVSYDIDPDAMDKIYKVRDVLIKNRIKTNLIISHAKFADFLPFRASKGRAIRYLSYRWNIPLDSILVAGDSGNDEDMLVGELLGVVVGNYTKELEKLKGRRRIYFTKDDHANGVIEGIKHYNFLEGSTND
jgi:sucrose-phosphate synthase